MKRAISIGFTVLMIFSVFVVMDIVPVENVKATGDPVWNGSFWETTGDWVVDASTSTFTYTDTTIVVNGNLTIENQYTLTLEGVTLLMNCSSNGQFNITVRRGTNTFAPASLIISDFGGIPSNITSYTPDGNHRFGFHVEGPRGSDIAGGYLEMQNSELHECGWNNQDDNWLDAGLVIQSQDAIISNCDISNNFRGLTLHNSTATGITIGNNTIHDNDATAIWISRLSTHHHLADNELSNNQYGIVINNSLNPIDRTEIIHNDIHDNLLQGISITYSRNFLIEGNTINNHTGIPGYFAGTGIFLWAANDTIIYDNYFENNGGDINDELDANCAIFSQVGSGLVITDNYITGSNVYGIRVQYQDDVIAENNELRDNLGGGAQFIFVEIRNNGLVNNNIIDNAGWSAIFVDGCTNFNVTNNTISNIYSSNPMAPVGLVQQNYYSANTLKVYNYNNEISNIAGAGGGVGMTISSGVDHVVDKMTIYDCDSEGISVEADNSTFKNCHIYNIGTTTASSASEYVSGIRLGGSNNVLENMIVEDCQATGGTYPISGIVLEGARDSVIKNSYLNGSEINFQARNIASNIVVENSTFNEDFETEDDFFLTSISSVTALNTQFNNASVSFGDAGSELTVKWYLDINVEDHLGNPEPNSDVWINDTFDTNEVYGKTDATGWLRWNQVTEYVQDNGGISYYTPHNVTARKDTRIGIGKEKMWQSSGITVILNNLPYVETLSTNASSVYRASRLLVTSRGEDVEDSDIKLTPHFEYRVNSSSPWVGETDPGNYFDAITKVYSGGVEGEWSIEFKPPTSAPIDTYEFRVMFNDTYPMYSDWEEGVMVDVLNNLPEGKDIIEDSLTVNRSESIIIWSDAFDIEDIDEDSAWDAELEYQLNGSSTWSSVYVTQSYYDPGTGNWKFVFLPPGTRPNPKHGPVDFRVRFQDKDDDWSGYYQELDLIEILNNLPSLESFTREGTSVYRGETIRVFADVDDIEEADGDLYVHFYYSSDGINWVDDWLHTDPPNGHGPGGRGWYDSDSELFFVDFSPPYDADLEVYEFRIYISDSDGGYKTVVPGGNTINVKNNLPSPIDITPSASEVRATGSEYVFLHINAIDDEDAENLLSPTVQWHYNDDPPDDWDSSYISSDTYTGGSPPDGYLRVKFTPPKDASLGLYDFRAKVLDQDGGSSINPIWVYINGSVEVVNPLPTLEDLKLGYEEVLRTKTIFIFLNASDLSDLEGDLTPEIQYKSPTGVWTDIPSSDMSYDDTNGNSNDLVGHWVISFTPAVYQEAGTYQFRGRVKNSAGGYSNNGDWTYSTPTSAEVKNNPPEATDIRVEAETVERGSSIYIYADGIDLETPEDDLTPHFEYKSESGGWEDEYLSDSSIRYSSGSWRITFTPRADPENDNVATLGNYDFKVWFEDDEGDLSNEIILSAEANQVEVINVVPKANSLSIPSSSGYRKDSITIFADASDTDHGEAALDAIFEYKGPSGDWIGIGDSGSYLGSPLFTNSQWQVTFGPDEDAELGDYSFRVRFYDGEEYSNYIEQNNVYEVKNNEPEVEITSPTPGEQPSSEVSFTATASDVDDDSLDYLWDFGDDSETSEEESPTHTYAEPGTYTVKVRVTDDNNIYDEDTISITIKGPSEEDGQNLMLYILLLVVIIVVVLLILVLLMTKKKKKPEETLPAAPSIPAEPATPPSETPAVSTPTEVPPAAPTAAPAAPAAAPSEAPAATTAGQQIKCPKCGTGFTVTSTERPITIECPACHAKGTLK